MKRNGSRWLTLPATALLLGWIAQTVLVASPAWAAEPGDEDQPRTLQLTVHPSAEPIPALKYRLLPTLLDRKPGNAAVTYNKLCLQLAQSHRRELVEKIADWRSSETPLAELPLDEVREALSKYTQVLDGLDLAARRDDCDWQLPITERNMFTLLLPELQGTRELARLLSLKARLQIAQGNFDGALRTLQTGYALGRHVGDSPTIVGNLVGIAIMGIISDQLGELIQQPESPNLYWALSGLPRPPISLDSGMETENFALYLSFPKLLEVHQTEGSPEYWEKFLEDTFGRVFQGVDGNWGGHNEWSDADEGVPWRVRLGLTGLAWRGYPMARQHLIDGGRSPEEVDQMPVPQVVAIYTVDTYDEFRDEMFKWFRVPYYQATEDFQRAEKRFQEEVRQREIIPVASLLLPAVSAVKFAEVRMDREIAMLRVVEAIRLYAAADGGRLPATLDDVTQVPIPLDPATGKPFGYQVDGNTATLEGHWPAGKSATTFGRRFEITLVSP